MSASTTEFKGQVALVTGASRGIGAAIALELAKQGLQVVGTATTDEGAVRISAALSAFPGCRGANLNVNDAAAGESLIDQIVKAQGGLHVLVNNAGITRDTLAMRMKDDDWDAVLDTNLKGTFACMRSVAKPMMRQRSGRIINMASVIGLIGNAGQANYAASKAGIIALTKSAAKELGSRNILINAVAPGFIDTEMTQVLSEDIKSAILKSIPAGKFGQSEDVAKAVLFLASDESSFITGQVITVDGGMVM